jgi:ankyrin repeat protein
MFKGVNVNIKNKDGKTPLELAETLNQPKIIALIKKHKPSSQ